MSLEGAIKAPSRSVPIKPVPFVPALGRTAPCAVSLFTMYIGELDTCNKELAGSRAPFPGTVVTRCRAFVFGSPGSDRKRGHIISSHHSQCFQVPSSWKARSKEPATEHTASGPEARSCKTEKCKLWVDTPLPLAQDGTVSYLTPRQNYVPQAFGLGIDTAPDSVSAPSKAESGGRAASG